MVKILAYLYKNLLAFPTTIFPSCKIIGILKILHINKGGTVITPPNP